MNTKMNLAENTAATRTHRFGVNYTPSRNWWYCWNDFDETAIARDLDSIAALGLDHLRIMLLWPYFQPNPAWVSPAHLDRLDRLMTLAGERGLDVCVTVLNGWLSGYFFAPAFLAGESIYTHEPLIKAQELLFREVAAVVSTYENFLGFDLGNEINCYQAAATQDGDRWMNRMFAHAAGLCPHGLHVNGVDHQPWFDTTTFSVQALCAGQAIVPIHCWTYFTGALKRGGALESPSTHLLAGMASLVRAYADDPLKSVWVQEYGASLEWMDEDTLGRFYERATLAAIDEGVNWFTWWCSHDIDPAFEFASLEYGLGMFTIENRPKRYTQIVREIVNAYGGKSVARSKPPVSIPPPTLAGAEETWRWLDARTQ